MLKKLLQEREALKAASRAILAKVEPDLLDIENKISALDDRIESLTAPIVNTNRQAAGKDTGIIHLEIDGVKVTHDIPKRVKWNQKLLASITQRIKDSGADPSEYVKIEYKVEERKYTAWPQVIKDLFVDARTLEVGKPTVSYEIIEAQGAALPENVVPLATAGRA